MRVTLQTGMPKKVRTLVDLEALLNDGTAYVLFVLLQVRGACTFLIWQWNHFCCFTETGY